MSIGTAHVDVIPDLRAMRLLGDAAHVVGVASAHAPDQFASATEAAETVREIEAAGASRADRRAVLLRLAACALVEADDLR